MFLEKVSLLLFGLLLVFRFTNGYEILTDEEYHKLPPVFGLDDYDDCLVDFKPNNLYCYMHINLKPRKGKTDPQTWHLIEKSLQVPRYFKHDKMRRGICVSKECPKATQIYYKSNQVITEQFHKELKQCFKQYTPFSNYSTTPEALYCDVTKYDRPVTTYHVIFAYLMGGLLALIIISTYYDKQLRKLPEIEYNKVVETTTVKFVQCFSLTKNHERLFKVSDEMPELKALVGVRAFGIFTTIIAHSILLLCGSTVSNPRYVEDFTIKPEMTIFTNGFVYLQVFFVLSGWMLTYQFFSFTEKMKTVSFNHIILAFVNRYIRLTVVYLVLIGFHSTWFLNMSTGPLWNKTVGEEYNFCRSNWWINILYIHNIYKNNEMCLPHTWYIATDTQLFLVSILIVFVMRKFDKYALKIAVFSWIFGIVALFTRNYLIDADALIRVYPESLHVVMFKDPNFYKYHTSFIVNIPGYLTGIICGYLFYKHKGYDVITSNFRKAIWHILWFWLPVASIHVAAYFYIDNVKEPTIINVIYATFSRPIFAIGMAIFFYGLSLNKGGFLQKFFELNLMQALGKLSYCSYLVHTVFIRFRGGIQRTPFHLTDFAILSTSISDITLAFFAGYLLSIFLEFPMSALQKLIMSSLTTKKSVKQIEKNGEKPEKEKEDINQNSKMENTEKTKS